MKYSFLVFLLSICSFFSYSQNVMTPETLWELGRVGLEDVSNDGDSFIYGVTLYDTDKNKGERNLYLYNIKSDEVKQITEMKGSEYGAQFLFDGSKIGFSNDGKYYLMDMNDQKPKLITPEKESLGNIKAFSTESNQLTLLFTKEVKLDQTTKDLYPELDQANVKIIDDLMYRHWDHWSDASYNHLHYAYYNTEKSELSTPKDIMEGERANTPIEPFSGSECYTLSPDGKKIVYESKKKTGKEWALSTNSDLYEYVVSTGKTKNITGNNKGYDKNPSYSPNGEKIAWLSMQTDGYESDVNDLVIYDIKLGTTTRVLEKTGNYNDLTFSSFRWANEETIFAGLPKDGVNQIYKVSLGSKEKVEPFAKGSWNYNHFEIADKKIIVSRQDMNHASEIYAIDIKKGDVNQLTHVNDEIYNSIELCKIEKVMVPTSDNKEMLSWVIYPPNFDPEKNILHFFIVKVDLSLKFHNFIAFVGIFN